MNHVIDVNAGPKPAHPLRAVIGIVGASVGTVAAKCAQKAALPTPLHYMPLTPSSLALTSESLAVSFVNLRCQVELQVAIVRVLEVVPHKQRCVRAEAELHRATQRRGLGEVHQVAQRKSGRDWLVHSEANRVLGLL